MSKVHKNSRFLQTASSICCSCISQIARLALFKSPFEVHVHHYFQYFEHQTAVIFRACLGGRRYINLSTYLRAPQVKNVYSVE